MNDEIGLVYHNREQQDPQHPHMTSEDTLKLIDEEVKKIISSCYEKAKDILTKHKKGLELIAENLLEFETLTGDEIKDILNGKKLLEKKMRRMRK